MARRYIVVPDFHVPYHCHKFINLITAIISDIKPAGIILLGDCLDFFQISDYDKDPTRKNTIYDDIMDLKEILHTWTETGDSCPIHYVEGNHEDRLRRYIWKKAPALHEMVRSIPDVLGLPNLKWYPYSKWNACQIADVNIHHGAFFNKHVAVTNLMRYPGKFICGHTHRFQYVADGDRWSATLGHGSLADKTAHVAAPNEWQQAFGILTVYRGKGSLEPVLVDNGKCIFRGEVVSA